MCVSECVYSCRVSTINEQLKWVARATHAHFNQIQVHTHILEFTHTYKKKFICMLGILDCDQCSLMLLQRNQRYLLNTLRQLIGSAATALNTFNNNARQQLWTILFHLFCFMHLLLFYFIFCRAFCSTMSAYVIYILMNLYTYIRSLRVAL